MRKKKIITLCLVLVLAALPMLNGTLAFFTDTDSSSNVMTMGSVEIVQHEQQRKLPAAAGGVVELEPFENGKKLVPSFAPENYLTYSNLDDSYKFFSRKGENLPNAIDKIVTVENKGNIPAYVRTVFAFEAPEGFNRNAHANKEPGWALLRNDIDGTVKGTKSNTEWKWTFFADTARFNMDDGQNYVIAVATAQKPLGANETTIPSLLQYYLNQYTGSEHVKAFGGSLEIYAFTQAVQADGFADVDEAFKESFGDITYDPATGKFSNLPWNEMIPLPEATVSLLETDAELQVFDGAIPSAVGMSAADLVDYALVFGIKYPNDPIHVEFENWHADFVLTFNKDIDGEGRLATMLNDPTLAQYNDKVVLVGSYLNAGSYPCPLPDQIVAGQPYRVMKEFGKIMPQFSELTYGFIKDYVETFKCGVVFDLLGKKNNSPELDDVTVTLELRLYETELDSNNEYVETGKSYVVASDSYTYNP